MRNDQTISKELEPYWGKNKGYLCHHYSFTTALDRFSSEKLDFFKNDNPEILLDSVRQSFYKFDLYSKRQYISDRLFQCLGDSQVEYRTYLRKLNNFRLNEIAEELKKLFQQEDYLLVEKDMYHMELYSMDKSIVYRHSLDLEFEKNLGNKDLKDSNGIPIEPVLDIDHGIIFPELTFNENNNYAFENESSFYILTRALLCGDISKLRYYNRENIDYYFENHFTA